MISIFILSILLSTGQQSEKKYSWICSNIKSEKNEIHSYAKVRLDITISRRKVTGKLKIFHGTNIIRVSDLIGVMYSDGSVSLAERWVDGKDLPWLPKYSSILITDINALEFRLNYNSASINQSHIDKGQMIFKKLNDKNRT